MTAVPYTITLSDDRMAAWLLFHTDASATLSQLHHDITAAGITHGIDEFLLADLAEAHMVEHAYCIARGTPPEDALQYGFALHTSNTPRRLPDGRVDFYNLNIVQSVVQQQVLVVKIPPEACTAGTNVLGETVPPTGHDLPLPLPGPNVALDAEASALIALTNGYPVLIANVLRVDPTYTVDGDIDFSVGNLTCVGHVEITGDVRNGFSVHAAQNVRVHGIVDGGSIDAGGIVQLYGNVFGHHKSHIKSARTVEGLLIDTATVDARKDITLLRGARHSDLHAGGGVFVRGDSSHIIGGTVRAYGRILTHNLGSEHEIPTYVEILPGAYDLPTSLSFLANIDAILSDDATILAQGSLQASSPECLQDITTKLQDCQNAVELLRAYVRQRQQIFPIVPLQLGTVVVTGTVYPGATINIGGASLVIQQPMQSVMFCKIDGAVQARPLEESCA
jgi:uncharacterized protein (DUF342 family)